MLHIDIPTHADLRSLLEARHPASLSLYLRTTPITQDIDAARIEMKNLARTGIEQLREGSIHKKELLAIEEAIDDLIEDDEFWRFQANSLAVYATPERVLSFRLPNALVPMVEAGDRFYVKPLLRAITVSQSAFVLALAQNAVRLVEVSADMPAFTVTVPDLPTDAASTVRKASILGRQASGRLQGSEGQKVHLRKYARMIDQALRDVLHGRETPLILASTQPMDGIYRSVNTYAHLVAETMEGNPDKITDAELAQSARDVLDRQHKAELQRLAEEFAQRSKQGRTTTDVAQAARAAVFGAVSVLWVDIDAVVGGTLNEEDGSVTFAEDGGGSASHLGVVDQIAAHAWLSGARVLGERRADIPGGGSLAAILRYPA
jgi:hypothetical protein